MIFKPWKVAAAVVTLVSLAAVAQQIVKADQGRPGNQGPWPVTVVSGGGGGGTVTTTTTPQLCTSAVHKVTAVSGVALACPSTQLAGRRYIVLCNSVENAAASLIKIRTDGVSPVLGTTNPGDVLDRGDCIIYAVPETTIPTCIANGVNVAVTSYECL
jgi:hypothetical protein